MSKSTEEVFIPLSLDYIAGLEGKEPYESEMRFLLRVRNLDSDVEKIRAITEELSVFFKAQRVYFIDVDLDRRKMESKFWYDRVEGFMNQKLYYKGRYSRVFENHVRNLFQWKEGFELYTNDIEKEFPFEYSMIARNYIGHLIGIPYEGRKKGFLLVFDPNAHMDYSPLIYRFMNYSLDPMNRIWHREQCKKVMEPLRPKNHNDVLFRMIGTYEASSINGVFEHHKLASITGSAVLGYIASRPDRKAHKKEFLDYLMTADDLGEDNYSQNLDKRLRRIFPRIEEVLQIGPIFEYKSGLCRILEHINVMTDVERFEEFATVIMAESDSEKRIQLQEEFCRQYDGVFMKGVPECDWIVGERHRHSMRFEEFIMCLSDGYQKKNRPRDRIRILNIGTRAEPDNMRFYYYLIETLFRTGDRIHAESTLRIAHRNLIDEDWEQLIDDLDHTDVIRGGQMIHLAEGMKK